MMMESRGVDQVVNWLSGIVVVCFSMFLMGLALLIAAAPTLAERFLGFFASSASTHYAEQAGRMGVGMAMVNFASSMNLPELFRLFGWLMIVTTVPLLLMPWQWHHRFATWVMPPVFQHLRLFALGAAALAAFILYGASGAIV